MFRSGVALGFTPRHASLSRMADLRFRAGFSDCLAAASTTNRVPAILEFYSAALKRAAKASMSKTAMT
jgi:hypothetical protein